MADLFADENVPLPLVEALRGLSHDVLTAFEAGRANQGIPDPDVLAHAIGLHRAVLTNNRLHFHRLHAHVPGHEGIVTFTYDSDIAALAMRIHTALAATPSLAGQLIRITRPS